MFDQTIRPRRLRASDNLRRLVRETRISPESLIWPVFVIEGEGVYEEIPSLPGQYHYSPDQLAAHGRAGARARRVPRASCSACPRIRTSCGSSAWDENGVVQQGIRAIKAACP